MRKTAMKHLNNFLVKAIIICVLSGTVVASYDANINEATTSVSATVSAGESDLNIPVDFTANTAYKVTVSWENQPVFSGARSGWSLQGIGDLQISS